MARRRQRSRSPRITDVACILDLGKNYDTAGWPQCGEIDIMEASPLYHNDRTSMFTMHWWNDDVAAP